MDERARQRRAVLAALALNASFLGAEVVGGIVFGSLALLADAAHMLSDVAALSIAFLAQRLLERPVSRRHTFGLQRAEVLGAQANGVLLLATTVWIAVEAVGRLTAGAPTDVDGVGLTVVAALGLLVNVVAAVILHRARGRSLNMRAAFVHMLADAAGSVVAVAAGVAILLAEAFWVDPLASLVIAALVLWSAAGLLRDTTHVLLEGVPQGLDTDEVTTALTADPIVREVHHLHVWSLASDVPALSAHVVIDGDASVHDAQQHVTRLTNMLADRFRVGHATLQMECHPHEGHPGCEPPVQEHDGR